MSTVTTHILDTASGRPAPDVPVTLQVQVGNEWQAVTQGSTNDDGRIIDWAAKTEQLAAGTYRITFDTKAYYAKKGEESFYPQVAIDFQVSDNEHYHIPLLLSPFGYSTYRGS